MDFKFEGIEGDSYRDADMEKVGALIAKELGSVWSAKGATLTDGATFKLAIKINYGRGYSTTRFLRVLRDSGYRDSYYASFRLDMGAARIARGIRSKVLPVMLTEMAEKAARKREDEAAAAVRNARLKATVTGVDPSILKKVPKAFGGGSVPFKRKIAVPGVSGNFEVGNYMPNSGCPVDFRFSTTPEVANLILATLAEHKATSEPIASAVAYVLGARE